MSVQWIAILRDALAIVVARSLARWLLDTVGASDGAMGVADLAVRVAAFCAIGCASPARRFARLGLTATCSWAIMLVIGLVRGAVGTWGADLLQTLLAMLLGGAASLAIVRPGSGAPVAEGSPAVGEDPKQLPPG